MAKISSIDGASRSLHHLHSEHAAMVQRYIVVGRIAQSYSSPDGKV